MRKKPGKIAFLPLVIMPALMPAIMLPLLLTLHLSGLVMGLVMGIPIGLSLVAIAWFARALAAERRRH